MLTRMIPEMYAGHTSVGIPHFPNDTSKKISRVKLAETGCVGQAFQGEYPGLDKQPAVR